MLQNVELQRNCIQILTLDLTDKGETFIHHYMSSEMRYMWLVTDNGAAALSNLWTSEVKDFLLRICLA